MRFFVHLLAFFLGLAIFIQAVVEPGTQLADSAIAGVLMGFGLAGLREE